MNQQKLWKNPPQQVHIQIRKQVPILLLMNIQKKAVVATF